MSEHLLEFSGFKAAFGRGERLTEVVHGIDFYLDQGETLALVGESGSGKTVSAQAALRLLSEDWISYPAGRILFQGRNVLAMTEAELRELRGKEAGMVFQEPMTSLNPLHTIEKQLSESLELHGGAATAASRRRELIAALDRVGLRNAEGRLSSYPHQLSGGERQRVMIALALINKPKLLIADEPTTALDVTIQAQILELMDDLRRRTGTAILLITHDLAVVAETAEAVVVMYAGRIVEAADVKDLFNRPLHPYTRGLMRSMPGVAAADRARLPAIPGVVPNLLSLPRGCRFNERCDRAFDRCFEAEPGLIVTEGRQVRCWLYEEA